MANTEAASPWCYYRCKSSLSCLSFCYCGNISDAGVELLGHVLSLASLDLSGCNIHDDGIRGLRTNPKFRYLMLAELMDITDDGLQVRADHCMLHSLHIGLQKMSSNLTNLDTLDLSDCEVSIRLCEGESSVV